MDFGLTLRELRNTEGITQKELSAILGLTANTVCEWEKGRSEPSIATIVRLATHFNVSTDYLLGRTDELGAVMMPGTSPRYSPLEEELIACFRRLPSGSQENLLGIARTLAAHV